MWGYELLSGSDAIDAGNPSASAAFDIRGYARDANPDIGAYEYGASGGVPGDTDGDGDVDLDDLFAVRNNFGTGTIVPEPVTLSLLTLGAVAGLRRRRR